MDAADNLINNARRLAEEFLPESLAYLERAARVIPGGASRHRFWWPLPPFTVRGQGATVTDIDGHEYVDCNLGYGSLILGHCHPEVTSALADQLARGVLFGAPSPQEAELAEVITSNVPGGDWVVFFNSGTEATLGAIRIARAATGRDKIAKFEGGWHGWHDSVLLSFSKTEGPPANARTTPDSLGIPNWVMEHVISLPFNDAAAFERIRREAKDLACVVVEGLQGGAGAIPAEATFIQDLREECDKHGILLVLDEVITGFRLGPSGVAGMFDVEADLTTLGKAIGGGLPVGAVCGSPRVREAMKERPDGTQVLMFGTFSGNPLTMVAGHAQLTALLKDQSAYTRLSEIGDLLRQGLIEVLEKAAVQAHVTGLGSLWGPHFAKRRPRSRRDQVNVDRAAALVLPSYLLREGVLMHAPAHLGFLSTAHDETHVDQIIEAHVQAISAMKRDGFFA